MHTANDWYRLESKYRTHRYTGTGDAEAVLTVTRSPDLLITAPHSLNHAHKGHWKPADRGTGGLAELLGQRLGASVIVPTAVVPNWVSWQTRNDSFRRALDAATARRPFTIDVHGMTDAHGPDLCIGLGPAPTKRVKALAAAIHSALAKFDVVDNDPFAAVAPSTITAHLQRSGAPDAIQLEFAARHRSPNAQSSESTVLVDKLTECLRAFFSGRPQP